MRKGSSPPHGRRQRGVRRLVREVPSTGEESHRRHGSMPHVLEPMLVGHLVVAMQKLQGGSAQVNSVALKLRVQRTDNLVWTLGASQRSLPIVTPARGRVGVGVMNRMFCAVALRGIQRFLTEVEVRQRTSFRAGDGEPLAFLLMDPFGSSPASASTCARRNLRASTPSAPRRSL
jgi:hypothetical protein